MKPVSMKRIDNSILDDNQSNNLTFTNCQLQAVEIFRKRNKDKMTFNRTITVGLTEVNTHLLVMSTLNL